MADKPAPTAGLEFAPGYQVIAVPTIWKLETGDDTAEEVCTHVARQMFGDGCKLWKPETLADGAKMFTQALAALEAECERQGRAFKVVDPVEMVVRIGGPTWREAGLRWVRIVKVSDA